MGNEVIGTLPGADRGSLELKLLFFSLFYNPSFFDAPGRYIATYLITH